ncbi:MAG: PIN domain-containing protein [Thermoplasmatota archaeon]
MLFRFEKHNVFKVFVADTLSAVSLLTLSADAYQELPAITEENGLDFDDAYQYMVAQTNNLHIVTMDRDFERVSDVKVVWI